MSSLNLVEAAWAVQLLQRLPTTQAEPQPQDRVRPEEAEQLQRLFRFWQDKVISLIEAVDAGGEPTMCPLPSLDTPQEFIVASEVLGEVILVAHDTSAMKVSNELRRRAKKIDWRWYLYGEQLMPAITLLQRDPPQPSCAYQTILSVFSMLSRECQRVCKDEAIEPYCWLLLVQHDEWLVAALSAMDVNMCQPQPSLTKDWTSQNDDPITMYITYRLLRRWQPSFLFEPNWRSTLSSIEGGRWRRFFSTS